MRHLHYASFLALMFFNSTSASAHEFLQPWKCVVSVEFQCEHGKIDSIERTAVGRTRQSAIAKALDAARLLACQPGDGPLKYFMHLDQLCIERRDG